MKARNPSTGTLDTVYVKALDSMPVGTQIEYTGDTIPTGWEEVNDYSTTEIDTGKKWINGKPIYRMVITITDTNATTNWKNYNYSDLGIPSGMEWARFPEAYTTIVQSGNTFWESFYSNGTRIQTSPADSKINILGNGASYASYVLVMEYTKSS